jgi:hypothetical protein
VEWGGAPEIRIWLVQCLKLRFMYFCSTYPGLVQQTSGRERLMLHKADRTLRSLPSNPALVLGFQVLAPLRIWLLAELATGTLVVPPIFGDRL